MELEAGFRIRLAPKFELSLDPDKRLQINSGSERDGKGFCAKAGWRAPTAAELELLVAPSQSPAGTLPVTSDDAGEATAPAGPKVMDISLPPPSPQEVSAWWQRSISLLTVPDHLRANWWRVAQSQEQDAATGGEMFEAFARDVAEYLRFKGAPLPDSLAFDLVVSEPGRRSTRVDPITARPVGLSASMAPSMLLSRSRDPSQTSRLLGAINLGDEACHAVFLNLSLEQMSQRLAGIMKRHELTTIGELVNGFLGEFSDYPLVRVRIAPGEGYWLADDAVVLDEDTLEKKQIDIRLLVRAERLAG